MLKICVIVVLLLFLTTAVQGQSRDEECVIKSTGEKGLCVRFDNCPHASKLIKMKKRPQHCGEFVHLVPIVCCPMRKSERRCFMEYPQQDIVLFVHGGELALSKEFPHMAALGYGDQTNTEWSCGGSLISDQFVLTAAHCIESRELGVVKFVRLGDLDLKDPNDDASPQNFTVVQIFKHPDYTPPAHYNDIALIKLDRKAKFGSFVRPACLQVEKKVPSDLTVTGWGKVEFFGESSSHLLKAVLDYIDHDACKAAYATISKRRLPQGILDEQQICAGHPEGKDTCPGDSGGPLHYKYTAYPPFYRIVGVTSFGKACGFGSSVGVYTRVTNYLSWIEEIVWPD